METVNTRIVFRADGNSGIGLGHIMRLLALVEMLKGNFCCLFLTNNASPEIKEIILQYCDVENINISNKNQEIIHLSKLLFPTDILVLDGYDFDEDYQQKVKALVSKLVMVDDIADRFYYADAIINHGGESLANQYRTLDSTQIYLGFKYLIARKEFLHAASQNSVITKVDTVFVCMGGADPFNHTIRIIEASKDIRFIKEMNIVIGSAYKEKELLQHTISAIASIKINLFENIGPTQMIDLIKKSEIAISSASSIALEICCVKSGLLTGTVINNQNAIHSQIIGNNCGISINDWNSVSIKEIEKAIYQLNDYHKLQILINNQENKIDGKSGQRIIEIFKRLAA